ncbi:MAG: PQQ-dependent sugar dehydrogenase [Chloroflexi bacterium]|nr:MAG: PQQ-dependent sugar dehydrogenase [Chloroflexota bacterium]
MNMRRRRLQRGLPLYFGRWAECVQPLTSSASLRSAWPFLRVPATRSFPSGPDGRLFFGEQFSGAIKIIGTDGKLQTDPFAKVETTSYLGQDWGLTGLAIDPAFKDNHFVYAFYTQPISPAVPEASPPLGPVARPTLVRFTDENGRGVNPTVISDQFPETSPVHADFNANGHIHFGPDGFLYVSLGDYDIFADQADVLRKLDNPIGKMLRINASDGSAAPGNPFAADPSADPRIFAYGFREPFDFVFQPGTGRIYATDNTTVSCEELNIIEPGKGYGWPDVGQFPFPDCTAGNGVDGIYIFAKEGVANTSDFLATFVEVSGLDFVSAAKYPQLGDSLLSCELGTGVLRRLVLSGPGGDKVTANDVLVKDCKRDVTVGLDGVIYYSTETEIRKLIPKQPGSAPAPIT